MAPAQFVGYQGPLTDLHLFFTGGLATNSRMWTVQICAGATRRRCVHGETL
eukprot:CAMPEP_0195096532 /NCGR_PEP_ID=MMETSP0448-20130528/51607_1 /TAXON_ID=66468 /ORGANISM="Heterocapsa triquestra, Strain CCMP 448" /LENGTH=50 /DNA_ID=CAMNT_0040130923 /DNA_START=26 /DNA_END=175 /DNA_ORIENTATION=+